MKKLSEIYKELGIAFSFPIEIYDANGYKTYWEASDGYWYKYERDANGNVTYSEDSNGLKRGTPKSDKTCEGKVVEVDGLGGIRSSMCLDSNSTLELMQKSTQTATQL